MPPKKIRLMLVDDHFIVRVGLASSLRDERDLEIVAEADNGEEAVELHRRFRPDVTLMDARLPRMSGFDAISAIQSEEPAAKFVMLTVHDTEEDVHRAFSRGVGAFLPKNVSRTELLKAIRTVARGESRLLPEVEAKLQERNARAALTPREQEVLAELARGKSNKEIGVTLGISDITVKIHVGRVLEKLGALDRTQAVAIALQRGLLQIG